MNRVAVIAALVPAVLSAAAGTAAAHHSFAAEFDAGKPVSLVGIVTKVEWTNPHVWIYFNVRDESTGEVVNWGAELGPPHRLQQSGWRRNTLTIGTEIAVDGFLARNGSPRVNARGIRVAATGEAPGRTLETGSSQLQGD